MTDVIERARSGRAKCRACARPIAKGDLRFGEGFPNAYAEGEAFAWFHVPCAALMAPQKLLAAIGVCTEEVPDRGWLVSTAELGASHHRLPRLAGAERASSGRAQCRHCRELIAKDTLRLRLQMFEEGRANPVGYIHVACAPPYLGTFAILDRLEHLAPELTNTDRAELARALVAAAAEPPRLAKTRPDADEAARRSG